MMGYAAYCTVLLRLNLAFVVLIIRIRLITRDQLDSTSAGKGDAPALSKPHRMQYVIRHFTGISLLINIRDVFNELRPRETEMA